MNVYTQQNHYCGYYEVATISRLLKMIRLFWDLSKEPCKRDDILQKRPVILRSLLIVATPYASVYKIHVIVYIPQTHDYGLLSLCTASWMWVRHQSVSCVSFAKYRLFYRALLQKRPIISKSLRSILTSQCRVSHRRSKSHSGGSFMGWPWLAESINV